MNEQPKHVYVIAGLALFFFVASWGSTFMFQHHITQTDIMGPTGMTWFDDLMVLALGLFNPSRTGSPTTVQVPLNPLTKVG